MLRAVRFAARFSFEIEPGTAKAIKGHAPKLKKISRERIGQEVRMMMEHPQRAAAARLMQELWLDRPSLGEENCTRGPLILSALGGKGPRDAALSGWALDRCLILTRSKRGKVACRTPTVEGGGDRPHVAGGRRCSRTKTAMRCAGCSMPSGRPRGGWT